MSRHNHHTCSHIMAHCAHCDVAYCKTCGREWGTYNYWNGGITWSNSNVFGNTIAIGTANAEVGNVTAHAHGG